MTRAIISAWHKYTPFGGEFYEPMLDFFLATMRKYEGEYDKVYLLDSTWNIAPIKINGMKAEILKVDPSLRYYDAYKKVLPAIQEDLVLFMDNDMVVYRKGIIKDAFALLTPDDPSWDYDAQKSDGYDVVSIMDTIGTWKSDKLVLGNKFCPYWFGARKDRLLHYLDIDWSPDSMPDFETLGKLTKAMVEDNVPVMEWKDDKHSIYFDGTKNGEKGKNLGYYHVRAGSVPAYLLATNQYGNKDTYNAYLLEQPRNEYIRQCAWYQYMGGNPTAIIRNAIGGEFAFKDYYNKFLPYHQLPEWKKA